MNLGRDAWMWGAILCGLGAEYLRLAWPVGSALGVATSLSVAAFVWWLPLELAAWASAKMTGARTLPVFRVASRALPFAGAAAAYGFACAWASRDLTAPEQPMVWALPVVSAMGVLVAVAILRHVTWLGRRVRGLAWGWVLVAAAASWWVNGWLPDLNTLVKWWAVLWSTAALAAWVRHEEGGEQIAKVRYLAVSVVVVLLGVFSNVTPLPSALAGAPVRSATGTAHAWLASHRDADGDGFFARRPVTGAIVEGSDCDDADVLASPASMRKPCEPAAAYDIVPRTKGRNTDHVFVFIVDAMRADVLTKHPGRFPNIEALANTGVNFTRAYSPGNATLMSLPSMLTGVTPVAMQDAMMRPDLKIQHYQTGRWLFDLDAHDCDAMIVQAHDYADWLFKAYPAPEVTLFFTDETPTGHGAPLAVRRFADALETCGDRRKTFVVYLDDPHIESDMTYRCADGSKGGYACYLEEIAVVDAAIGEMVAMLRARPKMARTTIVLTSDHGEAFGEHGHVAHASSVFEEQIHVPLIVHQPWREPKTVTTPVTTLGLAATVADETYAMRPNGFYPSLLLAADTGNYPPAIAYNWVGLAKLAWTAPSAALVLGDTKVQFDFVTGRGLQSDLGSDPGEHVFEAATPEQIQTLLRIHGTLMEEAQVKEAKR